jgi:hypothetical protein
MSRGWDYMQRLEHNVAVLSKGSRVCAGREDAMLMLVKAVVSVLQRWDIEAQESPIGAGFPEMQYANCQFVFAERLKT